MDSTSYKDLLKQREALDRQISEARQRELSTALTQVRDLIAEYGLSQQDVFPTGRAARAGTVTGSKVAPKYRNPSTGQTWTGRGKPPKWIQNQDREQFAI
ncbi:H-NS histone family protein [Melaminivora sp.]|uniref:H-NS histone family protein n=1 Tax=Melaminivora sp. TaxID=1933032 RepID=UPI0028AFA4CE|nr:H-NS histone family protein [Melaminivora sp.]